MDKKPLEERFMSKVEKTDHCWLWSGALSERGYGRINVGNRKTRFAHRVSYELFVGEIPSGLIVRHDCDNPRCVNPKHLQVGTMLDNSGDMKKRDRSCRGERQRGAKLTEAEVLEIKRLYVAYSREFGGHALGRKFGVSGSVVGNIINGRYWAYLERQS